MGSKFSVVTMRVLGNSMSPLLIDGDLVFIENNKNVRLGDVILIIDSNGSKLLHRVLPLGKQIFTMGDVNTTFDSPVKRLVGIAKVDEPIFRKMKFSFRMIYYYCVSYLKGVFIAF